MIADELENFANVTENLTTASELEDLINNRGDVEESKQLSKLNNEVITLIQPSLNSQLLVNPGSTVRFGFDVTNLRQQTVFHNFQVTGERSWLLNFEPRG